jgi:hypothetical protein
VFNQARVPHNDEGILYIVDWRPPYEKNIHFCNESTIHEGIEKIGEERLRLKLHLAPVTDTFYVKLVQKINTFVIR